MYQDKYKMCYLWYSIKSNNIPICQVLLCFLFEDSGDAKSKKHKVRLFKRDRGKIRI